MATTILDKLRVLLVLAPSESNLEVAIGPGMGSVGFRGKVHTKCRTERVAVSNLLNV